MATITEETLGDRTAYTLAVPEARLEAQVVPSLAMVVPALRHRGEDLLDARDGLSAYAERGATLGVPLLFPWANRLGGMRYRAGGAAVELPAGSPLLHLDGHGLPIHGAGPRFLPFTVAGTEATAEGASVRGVFESALHPEVHALYPFDYRLTVTVGLDARGLSVDAVLEAKGDDPVPVSFGWHPYLTVPGAPRETWRIEIPAGRHLQLDGRMIPTGLMDPAGDLDGALGDRTFDDGYTALVAGRPFAVAGGGRRLEVRFEAGCPFAQVYAPEASRFICFEPMTAPTGALDSAWALPMVAPGERYQAAFRVDVSET